MNRNLTILLLFLLTAACGTKYSSTLGDGISLDSLISNNTIPKDWQQYKLEFVNNLGTINIRLIPEFDTLLKWYDPGDCPECPGGGRYYYRIQSKLFPINKETGWSPPADSAFQLTISHRKFAFGTGIIKDTNLFFLNQEGVVLYDSTSNQNFFFYVSIDGRQFLFRKKYKEKISYTPPRQFLRVATIVKNRLILFEFIKSGYKQYSASFYDDCFRMISTIKIN